MCRKGKTTRGQNEKCESGSGNGGMMREMEAPGVSWRLYTQLTLLKYTLRLKTLNFFMFSGYFFFAELFIRNSTEGWRKQRKKRPPRGAIKIA